MQVRSTTIKRGNKTYQYAQLVESYRRECDGLPMHRVIANLGRITDPVQLDNLKAAFAANRTGERLVPVVASAPEPAGGAARPRRPQAILRYLDVAVVVEILRQLGLASHRSRLLSHHRGLLQLSFGFPSAEMGCTRHFGARGKRARG